MILILDNANVQLLSIPWFGETYVFSTFNKKEDFSRLKLFPERFCFITGSCRPPDSEFTMRKCTFVQCSQILDEKPIVAILDQKSSLCGTFCNITFSFLLMLTTVFKSNPKRLSISFYIPFVTWKIHSENFWPKITTMTLLAYFFGFSTFIYFTSSRIRSRSLESVKNSQRIFCWSKSINEFPVYRKHLNIIFLAQI